MIISPRYPSTITSEMYLLQFRKMPQFHLALQAHKWWPLRGSPGDSVPFIQVLLLAHRKEARHGKGKGEIRELRIDKNPQRMGWVQVESQWSLYPQTKHITTSGYSYLIHYTLSQSWCQSKSTNCRLNTTNSYRGLNTQGPMLFLATTSTLDPPT